MEKVTNYGWSKVHRPAAFYKEGALTSEKVRTENGAVMKIGDNLDISLLDEYSLYFASNSEKGSPMFVVKDGSLYLACYWPEIMNSTLKDELLGKVEKHELTAYDALALLTI